MKNNGSQIPSVGSDELNANLNAMLKQIMGRHTSSSIAKKCGVSVSTITRIRNGENKRGISDELLHKIWMCKDTDCTIDLSTLLSANRAVSESNMQKENAAMERDLRELDSLEKQIQRNMLNSGFFIRKSNESCEIIPDIEFIPDMSFEVAFESGEKRYVFFFTQFLSKRRIERHERLNADSPDHLHFSCRHYRTVMDFRELRALHDKYKNSELVIVFNYENDFRYNASTLKQLSDTERVTLALLEYVPEMPSKSGRFIEEICLDRREKGTLSELGLIK